MVVDHAVRRRGWPAAADSGADDNGGDPYQIPDPNCSLPPGVEINVVQMDTETPL
jgi:hypothetical protein